MSKQYILDYLDLFLGTQSSTLCYESHLVLSNWRVVEVVHVSFLFSFLANGIKKKKKRVTPLIQSIQQTIKMMKTPVSKHKLEQTQILTSVVHMNSEGDKQLTNTNVLHADRWIIEIISKYENVTKYFNSNAFYLEITRSLSIRQSSYRKEKKRSSMSFVK